MTVFCYRYRKKNVDETRGTLKKRGRMFISEGYNFNCRQRPVVDLILGHFQVSVATSSRVNSATCG